MISFDEIEFLLDCTQKSEILRNAIAKFRSDGPLDPVSAAKLEEHFKASHIYHSAGIEGNRLTL